MILEDIQALYLSPSSLRRYKSAALEALRALEQGLEESPGGVVAGKFTAVDISLFYGVHHAVETEPVRVVNQESYPRMYEWYQKVKERPAAKKAYE
jgi:glutathione S-transferase